MEHETDDHRYWNETADVGNINGSAIFDVETGFGGNGTGAGGCIADGPFADLTLHFKEDLNTTDYCVTRSLNDRGLSSASQENIDTCLAAKSFTEIWSCLEGRPHGAGHGGVSGTVSLLMITTPSRDVLTKAVRWSTSSCRPETPYSTSTTAF